MENEQTLTGEQSLELITSMINQAKNDYYDTGISALLWGTVIVFCSLATYANQYLQWAALNYIWFLTIVAEQHGPLAAIPLGSVARISAQVAPQADLNGGAARAALRRAVLAAQGGGRR